jgi:hypothetical protein
MDSWGLVFRESAPPGTVVLGLRSTLFFPYSRTCSKENVNDRSLRQRSQLFRPQFDENLFIFLVLGLQYIFLMDGFLDSSLV